MNMDINIVNRALYAIGQNPLADADISANNTGYQLAKSYYISTFLEALSEVEWVGGRKREKLVRTGRPVLHNRNYAYAYDMPFDCARPVELQENEYYIVEDKLILTDEPDAQLLYVANGRIMRPVTSVVMRLGERPEDEYMTAGPPGTMPNVTLYPGIPSDIGDEFPEDSAPDTDFPDYIQLDYEPKFYQFIEKILAAKFAIKLTDQPKLHTQLLQEALLIKQEAVDASRARRAAKVNPEKWWSQELGIN